MCTNSTQDRVKVRNLLFLHGSFMLYSFSAVFSKSASREEPFSLPFFVFWGLSLSVLVAYAIIWQLLLHKFPLSTAFSNRGVVVAWGVFWGFILFGEEITLGKIIAALLILIGIVILGKADG